MDHLSEHWVNGGTGLTNFSPEDFIRYREAVRRFGSANFIVSTERMIGRGSNTEGGSLHYLNDIRSDDGQKEVSAFWRVFDAVTYELRNSKAA